MARPKSNIRGFGINDVDVPTKDNYLYKTWVAMIGRCNGANKNVKYNTYSDCTVCDEWRLFSNFLEWASKQDFKNKQLDKDLLIPGNKVYSPETCIFIEKDLNILLIKRQNDRGLYPLGVTYKPRLKNKYQSRCSMEGKQTNLGYFATAHDAHRQWQLQKIECFKLAIEKQSNQKIISALTKRLEKIKKDYDCGIETTDF